MSLDTSDPRVARLRARLAPYARALLDRAGEHALRLHADVVSTEHLLSALMQDEECGAYAAVEHAFADPETIASEALAISPGVMVVASLSTLPFSPGGLRALDAARDDAERRGAEVDLRSLLAEAVASLDPAARSALSAAGYKEDAVRSGIGRSGEPPREDAHGAYFGRFSQVAKRALSAANRAAAQSGDTAIGPTHLAVACLMTDESLAEDAGLAWQRARLVLSSHPDKSPLAPRRIPADEGLVAFLEGLPEGATSTVLLSAIATGSTPELAQLLTRHKVTPALLERARAAFPDPEYGPE